MSSVAMRVSIRLRRVVSLSGVLGEIDGRGGVALRSRVVLSRFLENNSAARTPFLERRRSLGTRLRLQAW